MDKELHLKVDNHLLDEARNYARQKEISLSALIEDLLSKAFAVKNAHSDLSEEINYLSGSLSEIENLRGQDERLDYLLEKYK